VESDRLVGARILAPEGGELTMELSLAIRHQIPVSELARAFHPYLTPVEGMTCFSCEIHVEHSLKKLEGVREVKASSSDHSVTVSYDPAEVAVEKLVEAVNPTGYRARLPEKSWGQTKVEKH
jgi:copper chaperone CopZ